MTLRTGWILAAAGLGLAACDDVEMTEMAEPMRSGSNATESACMTAVNTNMTGSTSTVVSSDFSQAATIVMLRSSDGTNWRCRVSNDGVVEDLAVV